LTVFGTWAGTSSAVPSFPAPRSSELPGAFFQLQDNGNAVIDRANGTALWYGNSMAWSGRVLTAGQVIYSPHGQYQLVMQGDGNLVEYGPRVHVIHKPMTNGNPCASAI